jgi:hypothetical protein
MHELDSSQQRVYSVLMYSSKIVFAQVFLSYVIATLTRYKTHSPALVSVSMYRVPESGLISGVFLLIGIWIL